MSDCLRGRFAILLAVGAALSSLSGCSGYGKELKFNGGQLFYTSAVSKEQADKLGDYLVKEKFFDGNPKTVQLNKTGSTFEVRIVVKKGIEQDQKVVDVFKVMCKELSKDVFNAAPVDIHLCDENLKTLKVVVAIGI